ncbi:hypothetical protein Tco_0390982 [Tanacetum coccineum]
MKGIKKKKEKVSDTQLGEWKEERRNTKPAESHVLMISRRSFNLRKRYVKEDYNKVGEIIFLPLSDKSSANPIIIKAYVSGRQVNRVYKDSGSLCEVVYEHGFLKLNPSTRSLRVDSKTPLVVFSREHSWPLGEVPLEITIGEGLLTVTKTLNFVIVISDSPHNLLLGRTAMQQMGIVVSTIHGAIKFHTPKGIGTLLSENSLQGRNMEVNADEMVIKSDSEEEMLADIKETLKRLQVINLKVSPKKCSFRAEEWRFSGHLNTKQGIKADPSKVKEISDLQPPKSISEIQSLSKKLAAINRFLSKGANKTLPFIRTLKNYTSGKTVQWTTEAGEAF